MSHTAILSCCALLLYTYAGPEWRHHAGYDKTRLNKDNKECKYYAREATKAQMKEVKVPAIALHGGVREAFIAYSVFQDSFLRCIESNGWQKG